MKAICPISGVPFRTYDSLPINIPLEHPIFSLSYDELIQLLEYIREQEEAEMQTIDKSSTEEKTAVYNSVEKDLANKALEAIHEKNWKNPFFKLYQSKHLTMLAFMKMARLLEVEKGYAARPSPVIIEAYFWQASEIFVWANTISNPKTHSMLPKYRISKETENMKNFNNYLDILQESKDSIGSKYRSISEENKLKQLEQAITILTRRRASLHKEITSSNNHLAARWALLTTRAPREVYDFWFEILRCKSTQITFEGVKVDGKWEPVSIGDLRELRDYLEDNLIGPRGEHKQTHMDDSEFYYIARQTVLNIVRRHIAIIEQGTTSFAIVNTFVGDDILTASDDKLEKKSLEAGLQPKPNVMDYPNQRLKFIQAMAAWRLTTKNELIAISNKKDEKKPEIDIPSGDTNYEIL